MTQPGVVTYVVRATGPKDEVQYLLVECNGAKSAKERVVNKLKLEGEWKVEEPKIGRQL